LSSPFGEDGKKSSHHFENYPLLPARIESFATVI
jgi:hypothetical protein